MEGSLYGNIVGGCGISDTINEYISFELGNIQIASMYPNHSFQIGKCSASGENSFATGFLSSASGSHSVSHGTSCTSSGTCSSSFGISNESKGIASHTSGIECTCYGESSHVMGSLASDNGHNNSFVWGDSTAYTTPTAPNQFTVRASKGVRFIVEETLDTQETTLCDANSVVNNTVIIETSGTSWKYQTRAPECWANKVPTSITEAIDRLAKAYSKQKGQIP
jgi:hypothetical protein